MSPRVSHRQPEALLSLTAVLASSLPKTYSYTDEYGTRHTSEGVLLNEDGLIQQTNQKTSKQRRIRATPIGPDGNPHFEFKTDVRVHESIRSRVWTFANLAPRRSPDVSPVHVARYVCQHGTWRTVEGSCVRQLWACFGGKGDTCYKLTPGKDTFTYNARLVRRLFQPTRAQFPCRVLKCRNASLLSQNRDGFVTQKNMATGKIRLLRAAPWLGHATKAAKGGKRVDPTNGYYRGQPIEERKENAKKVRMRLVTDHALPKQAMAMVQVSSPVRTIRMLGAGGRRTIRGRQHPSGGGVLRARGERPRPVQGIWISHALEL